MAALQRVFQDELLRHIFVYIDDILIPGLNLAQHLSLLDQVLHRLLVAGMTVNLRKCKFLAEETTFLGFIVTPKGYAKDPGYVDVIAKIPEPTSIKSLQRVLGLFQWCHRFVPDYAKKARPLYDLLKEKKKWQWKTEHQRSFETLKQ